MKVGIATDHDGFGLEEEFVIRLRNVGHDLTDFGAPSLNPGDDYPDFIVPVADTVVAGGVERAVSICGNGIGEYVCANWSKPA